MISPPTGAGGGSKLRMNASWPCSWSRVMLGSLIQPSLVNVIPGSSIVAEGVIIVADGLVMVALGSRKERVDE